MKKTMRLLTMAELAVAGAVMAGCSGSDDIIDNPQPPTQKDNVVTVTTTVSLAAGGGEEGGATTRALDPATGEKTFAVGDRIAVKYRNTDKDVVTAVSDPITVIRDNGKTAAFTVTLTNPRTGDVDYVYPAAAAEADENPNFYRNNQDGTLETLQSTFDYSRGCGVMTVSDEGNVTLPAVELGNQMAILAITFKDADGSHTITSSLREVVIDFGGNLGKYTIRPKSGSTAFGQDVIYVAMSETNVSFTVTAVSLGGDRYTKTPTQRHYYSGNIYNLGWRMNDYGRSLSKATGNLTLQDGDVVTGTLAGNYKVSITDGATVTLYGATINGVNNVGNWAGLTCEGDATIILKDGTTNTAKGFHPHYPGIYIPEGNTLTIKGETAGTGSLDASSNGFGAGIGGGYKIACGNIEIQGGTITATGGQYAAGIGSALEAPCGTITISGGTIRAQGGDNGAGIGRGYQKRPSCGAITISGGTITAIGGGDAAGIGSGQDASCGDITISDGTITATGGDTAAGIGSGIQGSCSTITISGGTIEATGGQQGAGIGSGWRSTYESITITSGVTRVTATKGTQAEHSIGKGYYGKNTCGTVTIGGTKYWENNAYVGDGGTYLTQSPLVYQP